MTPKTHIWPSGRTRELPGSLPGPSGWRKRPGEALFTSTALMALLMAVTRCVLTPFLHFLCVYVEAATIMFIAISAFANECLRAHIGHSCVPAPAKILYITGLICFRSQWSPSGL